MKGRCEPGTGRCEAQWAGRSGGSPAALKSSADGDGSDLPRYDVVSGIGRWGTPAAVDTSRRSDRQGSRAERLEVLSLL
jgi:hypothetical protein